MRQALATAALLVLATTAKAETVRMAVVVGNNSGNTALRPLRYAETDAGKFARMLVEVGGVRPDDLVLLEGRPLAELEQALARLRRRIAAARAVPDRRVLLVFYFSGHSDGEALELGPGRLSFAELRAWLEHTGADVRLGVIDSCYSGALLAAKGGRLDGGFDIRLQDELATSGLALLTASASDEQALESNELRGSFFTHHLVSGLRGAADANHDGLVTLAEAYAYAYQHTVAATAQTLPGAQHPSYGVQLAGQGELVLADVGAAAARLALPRGFDRALIVDVARDQVVAELGHGSVPLIAVAPGEYAVDLWKGRRRFAGRVAVQDGQTRAVGWNELAPEKTQLARAKGGARGERGVDRERAAQFSAGAGVRRAASAKAGLLAGVRVAARAPDGPLFAAVDVATGRGPGYRESIALAQAGARFERSFPGLALDADAALGLGGVTQVLDLGGSAATWALSASVGVGAFVPLGERFGVELEAEWPLVLVDEDAKAAVLSLPAAFVSLALR